MKVYCITNNINGKEYVGLTMRTIQERFIEHCKAESKIGRAIRKYGVENFTVKEIDTADNAEELWRKESHWIREKRTFETGYNMTDGGWNSVRYNPFIKVVLTEKQQRFIKWVYKENSKDIDVHDNKAMIHSILINTMKNFLLANDSEHKRKNARLIYRLKPQLLEEVMRTKVIDEKQLKEWIA